MPSSGRAPWNGISFATASMRRRAGRRSRIGYHVYMPLAVEDVTRASWRRDRRDDDRARYEVLERAGKEIVQEPSGPRRQVPHRRDARRQPVILYTNFDIKDVRIVQAPPAAIGDFGGEIDNWMWPRHAGDYSFLRAYSRRTAPRGVRGRQRALCAAGFPVHQ